MFVLFCFVFGQLFSKITVAKALIKQEERDFRQCGLSGFD